MYTDNPQEKEDFAEVTSKDQENESTKVDPNSLFLLLSPPLKVVCSKLLSKYPEMMGIRTNGHYLLRALCWSELGLSCPNCSLKVKRIV